MKTGSCTLGFPMCFWSLDSCHTCGENSSGKMLISCLRSGQGPFFGQQLCTNLCMSSLFCLLPMLLVTGAPGRYGAVQPLPSLVTSWRPDSRSWNSMDARNFMTWRGPCLVCGKVRRDGAGIFCGNFLRTRGPFPPCLAVWCGECFRRYPHDPFPVQTSLEEEDEHEDLETEEKLANKFRHGRNGDHLMGIPFECDLCYFRNLNYQDPDLECSKDRFTLLCVQGAILDACWSRNKHCVFQSE